MTKPETGRGPPSQQAALAWIKDVEAAVSEMLQAHQQRIESLLNAQQEAMMRRIDAVEASIRTLAVGSGSSNPADGGDDDVDALLATEMAEV